MSIRKFIVACLTAFTMIFSTMAVVSLTSVNVMAEDPSPDPDPEESDDPRNPSSYQIRKITTKHTTGSIDCYNTTTDDEYQINFTTQKKFEDTVDFYLKYSQYNGLNLKYESFDNNGKSSGIQDIVWETYNGELEFKIPLKVYTAEDGSYYTDSFVIYVQDTSTPACVPEGNTGNNENKNQKSSTNTGTKSNVGIYAGLAGACVVAIGVIIFLKKKDDK